MTSVQDAAAASHQRASREGHRSPLKSATASNAGSNSDSKFRYKKYTPIGVHAGRKPKPGHTPIHNPGDNGEEGAWGDHEQDEDPLSPISAEERQQRDEFLESISVDAFKDLKAQAIHVVPEQVAEATAQLGPILQKAWTYGWHRAIVSRIDEVNNEVMALGAALEMDYTRFTVSRRIMEHINFGKIEMDAWDRHRDLETRKATAETACYHVLTLLPLLAECGLSWKMIVDHRCASVCGKMLEQAGLDEKTKEIFKYYICEDYKQPSPVQTAIVQNRTDLLKAYFDKGDSATPRERLALQKVIKEANMLLSGYNTASGIQVKDHHLPPPNTHNASQYACLLHELGYTEAALSLASPEAIKQVFDEHGPYVLQAISEYVLGPALKTSKSQEEVRSAPAETSKPTQAAAPPKSPSAGQRPPPSKGVPGPVFLDGGRTSYGQIVHIQKIAYGHRIMVDRGSEGLPIYDMLPGSAMPREYLLQYVDSHRLNKASIESRKHGRVQDYASVAYMASGANITYFQVRWEGEQDFCWVTRSDLTRTVGKFEVKEKEELLAEQRAEAEGWVQDCVQGDLHPDPDSETPGQVVKRHEKAAYPWIFKPY
ncbi:hypothetical protein CBER1_10989 [Cercospora berteroae]|uniref:Uncharacterized protein n=1 Tax=Cercospora berteroae TaxID=357750 RepID=A0A2S6BXE8_9PEZI|nr:hypothetical protein CBER1_10989 [Cercospora berteroae]